MKSQRQLQIGETIKRVISDIFLRDDIFFNKQGAYITVSQADASPDAKNVKIFVNIFGNDAAHEKLVAKLNEMAPHFRFQIAKKVALRVVPEIDFVLDKTQKHAFDISAIIDQEAQKFNEITNPTKKIIRKKR
jgi:ribosome-binding factor A